MTWRNYFTPPDDMPVWQWAEKNIILSDRQPTAHHGRYRTALTPYVRGIFDAINDINISKVTICKGAQTGLTLTAYVQLCYWMCEEPGPALVVMPTETLGKSASTTRIQPLFQDSPRVAQEITQSPDDFKKLEYVLKRGIVNIVGSNSPANLASRPAKYLILDETDKYPDQTAKEARAINLAIERTKTFWDKKILEISTPTTAEGYIYGSYENGDQRKYFIPCPKCGHMQFLRFAQIKFDEKLSIPESSEKAYYECEECGHHITNGEKINAVEYGEWRATAETKDKSHASFFLPSFYAPWVSWADVVTMFRTTKDEPCEFQNFVNSTLAEIWEEEPKDNVSISRVFEIRDSNPYPRMTVPTKDEVIVFMTVDRQKRFFPWCYWAANRNNLWLVDHGLHVYFADVWRKFKQPCKNALGNDLECSRMFLDTGYEATDTYEYCFKHSQIVPLKGDNGTQTSKTSPFSVSKIYPKEMQSLNLVRIHPSFFKYQLLDAMNGAGDMKIWFHEGINIDFAEQITGEVLVEEINAKTNVPRQYFKVVHTPQDYFDCAQYALCAMHMGRSDIKKLKVYKEPEKETDNNKQSTKNESSKFVPPARKRVSYG